MSARARLQAVVDRCTHGGRNPAAVMVELVDLLEVLNGSESELAATLQRAVDAPMPTVDDQVRDRLMAGTEDEQATLRAYLTLLGKAAVLAAQVAMLEHRLNSRVPFVDDLTGEPRVRELLRNVPLPVQIPSKGPIDDEDVETINAWLSELKKAIE